MRQKALCLLVNAAIPFVPGTVSPPEGKRDEDERRVTLRNPCWTPAEIRFFEEINENLLPLLLTFERLEKDKVPFKMALALSPVLCSALGNEKVMARYRKYLDRQIAFGKKEGTRSVGSEPLAALVNGYLEHFVQTKKYLEKKDGDILEMFRHFSRSGALELLASPATDCFLPFYTSYPEVIRAQLAASLSSTKKFLDDEPAGLWLTEMAYSDELDDLILDYHFNYTVVDTHGLLLADPPPSAGSFYPARTKKGLFVFARDFFLSKALQEIDGESYRDNSRDAGYELPREAVESFCGAGGERNPTGYKYWFRSRQSGCVQGIYYNAEKAQKEAADAAKGFVSACEARLEKAAAALKTGNGTESEKMPVSLIAVDIDTFGRNWTEGSSFLESFFREMHARNEVDLTTPYAFLHHLNRPDNEGAVLNNGRAASLETVTPLYSSRGVSGYAEIVLDSSNDWIYRHIFRAVERMIEIAERFDDSGIRERFLNQAAHELLLSQSALLAVMLSDESKAAYAKAEIEEHLKNFTAIYESLGHNFMSAKWLSFLEERDYVFPELNYRMFKKYDDTRRQGLL
jgi:1,4-alpha-glucan branching enzyme